MKRNQIWQEVELELRKGKKRNPHWPIHSAAQAGMVGKESGELMSVCLEWKYEKEEGAPFRKQQQEAIKDAAIQTIVAAIRFLENLK